MKKRSRTCNLEEKGRNSILLEWNDVLRGRCAGKE